MQKKTMITILLGVCIAVLNIFIMVNPCFAEIPKSELSLGGITPQSSRSDTMRAYGAPTAKKRWDNEWYYGDSIVISFVEGTAYSVTSTANNGWATPAGLTVGMNVSTALKLYGDPDKSVKKGDKTLYIYFVDYITHKGGHLGIVFDKSSKKISKLNIMKSTMADFQEYYPGWEKSMFE